MVNIHINPVLLPYYEYIIGLNLRNKIHCANLLKNYAKYVSLAKFMTFLKYAWLVCACILNNLEL